MAIHAICSVDRHGKSLPGRHVLSAIRSMLNPRSIAVVGASDRMGYGGRVISNLKKGGYRGRIYPVNPKYQEVQGLQAFATASAIPGPVDLAVIVVKQELIRDVVEDCGRKGVPAAAIITAGFAEQGPEGLAHQRHVVSVAAKYGMRLSGPNSLGIANLPDRVFAAAPSAAVWTREGHRMVHGPISIVSQSGALAFSPMLARSQERGIGLRYVVSVGNQCDLTLTDFVEFLVEDDPGTEVIGVFMEGLPAGEGARFLRVARRAVEVGKPILVLKVARSSKSAEVARSHTAVLTGNDTVYEGAFRQCAVVRVADLDDLWEMGSLFSTISELRADQGLAFVAASGGMNSLFSDHCSDEGVTMPSLEPETTSSIAMVLQGRGHAGNPTDASGQFTQPSFQELLGLFERDPAVDLIGIGLTQLASGERSRETAHHIMEAYAKASVPYFAVWASATTLDGVPTVESAGVKQVQSAGIPVFDEPAKAARALGLLQRYTARKELALSDRGNEGDRQAAAAPAFDADDPVSVLRALEAAGISVAQTAVAQNLEDAQRIAERTGFPVVLKIDAPGLLHKTEVGGVRLHVDDVQTLATAYGELWEATAELGPDRRVLVQEEVEGGAEFLLGGLMDPIFGPVVTLGSGGTWAELADDVTTRVAPLSAGTARSMVGELRSSRILAGLRGTAPKDVDAFVDTVVQFSHLVAALQGVVEEVEINPLLVLPEGAGVRAVDVLVVTASSVAPR